MKLSKFPVTSLTGNEYRVTIREKYELIYRDHYEVTVYRERKGRWIPKIFRFERLSVYTAEFACDDFIRLASAVVGKYERQHSAQLAEVQRVRELAERKAVAAEAFRKWNGLITEEEVGLNE